MSVPAAAISADQFCAEHACAAVSSADFFSAPDFFLHGIPFKRIDNGFVAVFDIVLRNLALVDRLLFGQKIRGIALLKKCRAAVFFIL